MIKKKKIIIFCLAGLIVTIILTTVLFWPHYSGRLLLLLTQEQFTISGIKKYSPTNSSVSLCAYLTVRNENKVMIGKGYEINFFCNKYPYKEAFYRCEKKHKKYTIHETVVMALTYDDSNYSNAYEDITSQDGFSDEITFNYKSFSFFLNRTEYLTDPNNCLTNYCFSCNNPYIEWINLVGFDQENKTIVFVGFYHCEYSGFNLEIEHYYVFVDWDTFFSENFSYYEF